MEREKEQAKQFDMVNNQLKQKELKALQDLDELKHQLEQLELDKSSALKRMKEKEKKIALLEGKISDLEEDKLAQFRDFQEQQESQKTFSELQIVDLKKRIEELTQKCEDYKKQIGKLQSDEQ